MAEKKTEEREGAGARAHTRGLVAAVVYLEKRRDAESLAGAKALRLDFARRSLILIDLGFMP